MAALRMATGGGGGFPPGDRDQAFRLAAFRASHPSVTVGRGTTGWWTAFWRDGRDSEVTVSRPRLADLLDKLDERFWPGPDTG
jgi:hypothetical protein